METNRVFNEILWNGSPWVHRKKTRKIFRTFGKQIEKFTIISNQHSIGCDILKLLKFTPSLVELYFDSFGTPGTIKRSLKAVKLCNMKKLLLVDPSTEFISKINFPSLQKLDLRWCHQAEAFNFIRRHSQLKNINLEFGELEVDWNGFTVDHLKLEYLKLSNRFISEEIVCSFIQNQNELKSLSLPMTTIADRSLRVLVQVPHLENFGAILGKDEPISEELIIQLSKMQSLTIGTQSEEVLKSLAKIESYRLEKLSIISSTLTSVPLSADNLPNLKFLSLISLRVNKSTLNVISNLKKLETLKILCSQLCPDAHETVQVNTNVRELIIKCAEADKYVLMNILTRVFPNVEKKMFRC